MGTVVWVYDQAGSKEPNSSGMGIEFTDILEKEQVLLRNWPVEFE